MRLSKKSRANRRSLALLSLGSLVGILACLVYPKSFLTEDASVIAIINGGVIRQAEYQRAIALFDQNKRGAMNAKDHELILDRLIDEELLVQLAISSDAMRSNPDVRQRALQTLLASIQSKSATRADGSPEQSNLAIKLYLERLRKSADIEWLIAPENLPAVFLETPK